MKTTILIVTLPILVAIILLEVFLYGAISETCDSTRNYDFED